MSADFPQHPQELGADWLSAKLGFTVTDFDLHVIGEGRGNLGEIVRIDFGDRHPRIVAKFAADRADALAAARRTGLFEREIRFYNELSAIIHVPTPACHFGAYDSRTGSFVLLLEDVESDGELDSIEGIGPEATAAVLDSLAKLHGRGFDLGPEHTWLQPMTFQPRLDNLRLLIAAGWPALAAMCDDFLDPAIGTHLADRIEHIMRRLASRPQTIVHGDAKPDNMKIRTDPSTAAPEVVLLDWQAVGTGPPAWDIAYTLVQCLTSADRRAHQDELLASYPHDLTGLDDAFWMGLVVAAALPVIGDPSEPRVAQLARMTAERTVIALDDHGIAI